MSALRSFRCQAWSDPANSRPELDVPSRDILALLYSRFVGSTSCYFKRKLGSQDLTLTTFLEQDKKAG